MNKNKKEFTPALNNFGVSLPGKRGFTLIELLVTIGILAVLATVVVLVLNPAELFRQARDVRRISDLNSLNDAINLYLTIDTVVDLSGTQSNCGGGACTCSGWFWGSVACANESFAALTGNCSPGPYHDFQSSGTGGSVNGTGWMPINFSAMSLGSPLSSLPIDPTNTPDPDGVSGPPYGFNYSYRCDPGTDGSVFEIDAQLESAKYIPLMDSSKDGGNSDELYEIGNDPGLNI